MSSLHASKTPEYAPAAAALNPSRRSFTLPARIANRPQPSPEPANTADGIETLFVCTSTKIVSFTASSLRRASPSRRGNGEDDTRSIPWRTPTERTMAVGVLRIYRVISSNVSFLNSGNLLHTIFPRSQCWRVDGESIFVLRVRQDSYYRMELPYETSDDKEKVEQFKSVLAHVLQFEKTQSPFSREVQVQLPERPKTPPRRRLKKPPEKAKKWLFDKKWMPESASRPSTPVLDASDSGTTSSYEEDDRSSINTDKSELVPESPETLPEITSPKPVPPMLPVRERAKSFQMRSITAPISTNLVQSHPSEASDQASDKPLKPVPEVTDTAMGVEMERKESVDAQSIVSANDSFYSLEPSTRSPSPPYVDAESDAVNPWADESSLLELESRGRSKHRRQVSEMTLKASSPIPVGEAPTTPTKEEVEHDAKNMDSPPKVPSIDIHLSSAPSTPPLVSDSDDDSVRPPSLDVPTPPAAIRMKRLTGASQRRAYSPMPQPQNLFCPPTRGPSKQFTAALIRKTCEIVLGPPAHLVQLMLRIAANITDGVFGFNTYRVRPSEKIPCSWESSDEEDWPEDDFGIPLRTFDDSTMKRNGFSRDVD
ncbi:hypothetical protein CC80DRAFT_9523 [Byssothecium circinans]|uniref:Inheritance of peroxisomes protein 1 n=1 Tax=Byssothecium circinans TaxID=147558 RepID=A0A6A5UG36_9PLEO|nr:hypothetical protein CC80DRAFT_9523 [Byssothecium circinans]